MTRARLVKVQAASGLAFGGFLFLHLLNTGAAAFGPAAYDAFQRRARVLYHLPAVELGCIGLALMVHVVTSLVLARGRNGDARVPLWLRAHRISGYLLTAIVGTHALATRGVGLTGRIPIAAEYVTFVLQAWPAFFYPYYALLLAAGAYHFASGVRLACARLGLPVAGRLSPAVSHGLTALLVGVGLWGIAALGGTSGAASVPDAAVYQRFFCSVMPNNLCR